MNTMNVYTVASSSKNLIEMKQGLLNVFYSLFSIIIYDYFSEFEVDRFEKI